MAKFTQNAKPETGRATPSSIFRRDPDTGMLQMARAKSDTAMELYQEQRKHGQNAYRVNQYFNAVMNGTGKRKEAKYNCDICRDQEYVTTPVETDLGVYTYALQCACVYGKPDGFGAGFIMNVRDVGL